MALIARLHSAGLDWGHVVQEDDVRSGLGCLLGRLQGYDLDLHLRVKDAFLAQRGPPR